MTTPAVTQEPNAKQQETDMEVSEGQQNIDSDTSDGIPAAEPKPMEAMAGPDPEIEDDRDIRIPRTPEDIAMDTPIPPLHEAALAAGRSLFGDKLVFPPIEQAVAIDVEHVKLSTLQALDPEEDYVDEYEYIFFPRRGGGLDVSSETWRDVRPSWVDDDGFIYTAWAEGTIRVVEVDVVMPMLPVIETNMPSDIVETMVSPPSQEEIPLGVSSGSEDAQEDLKEEQAMNDDEHAVSMVSTESVSIPSTDGDPVAAAVTVVPATTSNSQQAHVAFIAALSAHGASLGLLIVEQSSFWQFLHTETGQKLYVGKVARDSTRLKVETTLPLVGVLAGASPREGNGKISTSLEPQLELIKEALAILASGSMGKIRAPKRAEKSQSDPK